MLNSISWEQFFTTMAVLVGGYYVITTLLLFGDEIKSIFSQKRQRPIDEDNIVSQRQSNHSNTLMGPARQLAQASPVTQSSVEAEAIIPGSAVTPDIDPIEIITDDVIAKRMTKELHDEITSLIEEYLPKSLEEVELVLRPVFERYAGLLPPSSTLSINQFVVLAIAEKTQLQITETQIQSLWPETKLNDSSIIND